MKRSLTYIAIVAVAAQGWACANTPFTRQEKSADAALLHDAMRELTGVMVYDIFSPPQASRVYAYASVAAYEVLRQEHPEYQTLAGQLNGLSRVPGLESGREYYAPLAATEAFLTVGKAMTFSPARMDSVREMLRARVRGMRVPAAVFARSVAYGDTVAKHILAWAAQDHYLQTRGMAKYTVTSAPGRWIPTPPAYMDAVEPNWFRIRPFVLDSASQFPARPPLPFDTTAGSPFMKEAREVFDVRNGMTDAQRAIAAFWDCNPYVMHVQGHTMFATKKITPGGHWIGIVEIASRTTGADAMRAASAYARTAVTIADAFIVVWEQKYRSNLIRPETVINKYIDARWEPLLQTPPFPEYTSGHSVVSNAAAVVLSDEFGDRFHFHDDVEQAYGLAARDFASFKGAAAEAAISRLYGGIHFRRAIEEGALQGQKVGALVVQRVHTRQQLAGR